MSGDLLPIAVRAYAELRTAKPSRKHSATPRKRYVDSARRPQSILVFDCETTIGSEQALLFGCYRYYTLTWHHDGPQLACKVEGLLHADELELEDPEAHELLGRYARAHRLRLHTRAAFVQRVFLPALAGQATVVTFNAPFDLSRIACGWSVARGKGFEGGFSFPLVTYIDKVGRVRESRYKPRVRVRPLDSKRARLGLGRTRPGADHDSETRDRGAFLDLRTLAYALSSKSHSLESACSSFGVPDQKRDVTHGHITAEYIDYCREDVAATASLYQALACEYERHGLQRAPTRIYSPASLAKAYLQEAGIRPPLQRQPCFPKEVIGYAMAAYYGGRAECRIRRIPVPVTYLDFASMYPTVCALLGLWRFHTCKRIKVVDENPAKVERWLASLTLEDMFDGTVWPRLCGLVLVEPHGDVLPVRARYSRGGSYGIGVNPFTSAEPLWYTLADVVTATLLGGRPPKIVRALRFVPVGVANGLRPLRIRGSRPIDPYTEDVYCALVEERRQLETLADPESLRTAHTLKTVVNAAGYGISVELNRHEPRADPQPVHVYGLDCFDSEATAIEEAGAYFFPPLGALVTGAARLMLALLERCVTDAGGSYAFCDTDSMSIVSTQTGGLVPCNGGAIHDEHGRECIRALSWEQVDGIVDRFQALNPYDQAIVPGSILELERENYDPHMHARRQLQCYAISAKRYALYTMDGMGGVSLVKGSEHALGGFYMDPTNTHEHGYRWVDEVWTYILSVDAMGDTCVIWPFPPGLPFHGE